jgi:hypothetical protein
MLLSSLCGDSFRIDYVRVYQPKGTTNLGCDPVRSLLLALLASSLARSELPSYRQVYSRSLGGLYEPQRDDLGSSRRTSKGHIGRDALSMASQ